MICGYMSDMYSMDFKAYGVTCKLNSDSLVLTNTSFVAKQAMGGVEERTIWFKDIVFLEFKKGNLFVNTRIIIGEVSGKTYIPVVPWGKNNFNAEVFYNALYDAAKPLGNLSSKTPAGLRNDRLQAFRDQHGVVNQDMVENTEKYATYSPNNDKTDSESDINNASSNNDVTYGVKSATNNDMNHPAFSGVDEVDGEPSEYVQAEKQEKIDMEEKLKYGNSIQISEYNETMPPIVATEYAIIDLETTGLSPDKGDKIIEIGIMIVDAGYNIISKYETLVNPLRPVKLTHVHGIDDRMVSKAPTIADINDDVLALLHNRIVVAHNAMFEQKFLNSELNGKDLTSNNFLDTLKYARLITPTENHKLGTIAEFYGVPYVDAHTAMGDVIVTQKVLARMLPSNPESQFIASEDLTAYFNPEFGETQPAVNSKNWVGR